MTKSNAELAEELQKLAKSAPYGERVAYLVLFGIKNADFLHRDNITDILEAAGIAILRPKVNVGRQLARHVALKDPDWPS